MNNWPDDLNVDADGASYDVYSRILLAIATAELATTLYFVNSRTPAVTLGSLFYTPRNPAPPEGSADEFVNKIVDALDSVFNTTPRDRMRHFCVPFVEIQKGRALACKPKNMEDFLDEFKTLELKHFFTTHGSNEKRKKVKEATEAGILRAKRPSGPSIMTTSGNGKWCCNGSCVNAPRQDYWCVQVTVGSTTSCALGSDIDPSCYPQKKTKKVTSK
jgi:hypothetical protein